MNQHCLETLRIWRYLPSKVPDSEQINTYIYKWHAKGVNTSEIHWLKNLLWCRLVSSGNRFGALILPVCSHMFQERALVFNVR